MKFFTAFLFIFFSFKSVADTDLKETALPNGRVITVTGHPTYPPVMWINKDTNQFQGIAIELLQMIFSEINVKVSFINVDTWARAQEEVKSGRIDMLLPPYKTSERISLYNFAAESFMRDETVVFVRKGMEFKFDHFNDLLKFPGTAIINDSFGSDFDSFEIVHKNLTRLATSEQCFRFVDKGRARYVIAGLSSGTALLSKMNWEDKFSVLPKRVVVTGMYAPISLKSRWNNTEINNYLKKKFDEYNRKGIVKQLEKKYLAILKKENKDSKILLNKSAKTSNGPT